MKYYLVIELHYSGAKGKINKKRQGLLPAFNTFTVSSADYCLFTL